MRIGIVAGEASGDILGAGLVRSIKARYPDAAIEGVTGPQMRAAGCETLFEYEELAVFGIFEVLRHLPRLLGLKKRVIQHFKANPPDVFIGIDAPDFNLRIEKELRQSGIKTVQYVSPSVWAWREKRIFGIVESVDLMLTLFPFETAIYDQHGLKAVCVGHTLADQVPDSVDQLALREQLGLAGDITTIAVLPGSRGGEIKRLGSIFLQACSQLASERKLQFVVPCSNQGNRENVELACAAYAPNAQITVLDGQSREAMGASDIVLLASGTATLEALLLKRPMVVAYKLSALTFWFITFFKLMRITRFSLPNLLSGKDLVPELMQDDARVENVVREVSQLLDNPQEANAVADEFQAIHNQLRLNASERAADAVLELVAANTQ
ncbi:MAG: lipid-A-disaccharide synthase [Gammaproteobacteria bacterium]